jgi:hypothetical protein
MQVDANQRPLLPPPGVCEDRAQFRKSPRATASTLGRLRLAWNLTRWVVLEVSPAFDVPPSYRA